jgi:general secretion pathway protein D
MRYGLAITLSGLFLVPVGAQEKPQDEEKVKISFSGIELDALAQQVERVTKKSFIVQEQLLKGKKVTLQSEKPITPDEFFRVFQSVCLMHGFALVPAPEENINLVKIVPAPQGAKEPGAQPVLARGQKLPQGDGVVYYVVAPKHISATKAMAVMTTAISPTGVMSAVPNSDLVLVIDASTALGRVEKLLGLIDIPGDPILVAAVPVKSLSAASAKTQLAEFMQAFEKVATGEPSRSRIEIMADERLGQLHLIGRSDELARAQEYLRSIDRLLPSIERTVEYYRLKNAPVQDVAESVRQFLGLGASGGGGRSEIRKKPGEQASAVSGKPARELSGAPALPSTLVPPQKAPPPAEEPREPAVGPQEESRTDSQGRRRGGPRDIEIFALEAQNTLVVIANQAVQDQVKKILENVDRRRSQVLIEVAILQVTSDDSLDVGVEVLFRNNKNAAPTVQGGTGFGLSNQADPGGTGFPTQQNLTSFTGGALRYIKPNEISALIHMISAQSRVNVLSQPLLLVNDNEDANFTTKVSQPTLVTSQGTTTTQTSFAGFADATTSLTITPQISPDGYINLKIAQTFEEFSGTSSTVGVPPPKVSNNVTTMITVPDRHTAILGGFTRDSLTDTRTGIPILMDFPVLGPLVSQTSKDLSKSRLYLFVRPLILSAESFEDLKKASMEKVRNAQPLVEDAQMRSEVKRALTPKDLGIREAPLPFEERK